MCSLRINHCVLLPPPVWGERLYPLDKEYEVYHPIRLLRPWYNHMLNNLFDVEFDTAAGFTPLATHWGFQEMYVVARKKKVPLLPLQGVVP